MSTFTIIVLIVTHIAAFAGGALVFRSNATKANKIIDTVKEK